MEGEPFIIIENTSESERGKEEGGSFPHHLSHIGLYSP